MSTPHPVYVARQFKSIKTTFKLTTSAIEDLDHVAAQLKTTKRKMLDIILQAFIEGTNYPDEETFFSVVIHDVDYDFCHDFKRTSLIMSEGFTPWLEEIEKETGLNRNAIVDGAIKTFRKFFELSHPLLQEEVKILKEFMKEIHGEINEVREKTTLIKWRDALLFAKYPILEQWDDFCEASEKFNEIINDIRPWE